MPDYNAYIEAAGISAASFTKALRAKYPSFSKVQKCMVCQPDKYGVQLLPEAEAALIGSFGKHTGLSGQRPKTPGRKAPARTKPNRFVVYLPDETAARFCAMMRRRGYHTVQEALCEIIARILDIEETMRKE